MSDTIVPAATVSREEFDKLQAQLAEFRKANVVEDTVAQCNVCGDTLAADVGKCPKHPFDHTNHVRPATDKEKAEAGARVTSAMNTLVRQS